MLYTYFTGEKEEILYFENFDLETLVTPINVDRFCELLRESDYDKNEIQFIWNGFNDGFPIEYHGEMNVQIISKNLPITVGSPTQLWNKVMKEVKEKRFAGPFFENPYKDSHFIQSPIGLVPKDNGRDTRLIFHLSHPRGTGKSVNANTPERLCKVTYPNFDDAVKLCVMEGVGCFISRSDAKSAFRNICIRIEDYY